MTTTDIKLALTQPKRLAIFGCITIVGFFLTTVVAYLITLKFGGDSTPAMRIAAIMQDVLLLILPAIATAMLVTRRPADLLALRVASPRRLWLPGVLAAVTLVVSTPAMNAVIAWNAKLPLPEGLAAAMLEMEQSAAAALSVIQGHGGVGDIIVAVFVMGVAAGFAEELFFRGAFQRLLVTGRVNVHAAVWVVGIVFSLVHMQFYGFVPRMLLGVYFGYLMVWSGTVWLPIIIHALNNTLYVLNARLAGEGSALETIGTGDTALWAAVSVVATVALLYVLNRVCRGCGGAVSA